MEKTMSFSTDELEMLGNCIFFARNQLLHEMLESRNENDKEAMKVTLLKLDELERKVTGE